MNLTAQLKVLLILIAITTRSIALNVSWNFGKQECAAMYNLKTDYTASPMTMINWNSPLCWTNNVVPIDLDDVQIICNENCGQTGPIAIQISSNVSVKSLRIMTSTPTKYISLQIINATLSILGQFNVTAGSNNWFSLQIFPTSYLLLYDRASLDASVFNGGSISAPLKRVTVLAFYVEMCGNADSSLINVDIVSIMGAKDSQATILKRATLLQVTDTATQTFVQALRDPNYFLNSGACQDFQLPYRSSYVPGIFFSGSSAILINATVDVTSFSSNRNSMFIFNHSFQSLVGQNCNLKSNSMIVFQNGPRATQPLLLNCSLQSSETIHIARSVQFQKETEFYGTTKTCLIALVGVFLLNNSDAINALVSVRNSLNISSCTVTVMSLKSSFDSKFALIVINQSSPKTMSLSLSNMVVNRQGLTNNAPLTDVLFYSCSDTAYIGKIKFSPSTSLVWSCSTSLTAGASIDFAGNLLNFDGLGRSLMLSDPTEQFNITISHVYKSKVLFLGYAIQVALNIFILNSGTISIGGSTMERGVHNVSCKLFSQTFDSSVTLKPSAVLIVENVFINAFASIDGVLIAKTLTMGETSNVSGTGHIFIESNGLLAMNNSTSVLTPSLTAKNKSTIPGILRTTGTLCCHSCNFENAAGVVHLTSFSEICMYDMNLSQTITLIAPRILLHNFMLINGIMNIISHLTICSGISSLSALNFTNQFRIEESSIVQVFTDLAIPVSATFNISGHFRAHVANVDGVVVIGRNSKSYIHNLDLRSAANMFVSGHLILSSLTANCEALNCNIFGGGSLVCLTHFKINALSTLVINLRHVACVGTFSLQHQSTIHISNTFLNLSNSNASVIGDFFATNATLWISECSSVVLKNSHMNFFSSFVRMFGHFATMNSTVSMDATCDVHFGEQSQYLMEKSTMIGKQLNFSGKHFTCANSVISSNVTMLNDVSISQCYIIGNAVVETGCIVTISQEVNWGMNVSGNTTFRGYIRAYLDSSTQIGYSICILASENSVDANIPVIVDGVSNERVRLELESKCVKLIHRGCPPGKESFNVSGCIKCNVGYNNSQYDSKCQICPEGMYASSGQSSCHWVIGGTSKPNGIVEYQVNSSSQNVPYHIPIIMVPILACIVICFSAKKCSSSPADSREVLNLKDDQADTTHPKWVHRKSSLFSVVPMMQSWNMVDGERLVEAQGNDECCNSESTSTSV